MMQFELPKERPSIIKVIGVGGGGSNAVNHMYRLGIKGVDFLVCNTDHQALEISPVPFKIQLGPSLTEGRGAGAIPEVGKNAAIENIDELKEILRENTKMVFITAGMGGGTGTGAAPIIAGVARDMGILTVAIVTVPFAFEGKKRRGQADAGIEELKKNVDTLLVICNDKLREIHGNLKLSEAFGHADDILAIAAKSIAEIITTTLHINVDFADIQTVMKDSGVAIMGSASSDGDNRAMEAVRKALDSPLLNDNEIEGARYVLLNITSGNTEVSMDEMGEITDYVQEQAGQSAEVIMGVGTDETLGSSINVTIIATGFKTKDQLKSVIVKEEEKVLYSISGEIISNTQPKQDIATSVAPVAITEPVKTFEKPSVQYIAPMLKVNHESPASEKLNSLNEETRIVHILNSDEDKTEQNTENPQPVSENRSEPFINTSEPTLIVNPVVETEEEKVFVFELNTGNIDDLPAVESSSAIKESPVSPSPIQPVKPPVTTETDEDPFLRAKERVAKLREMSMRINTPGGLSDFEKEPAYKRKGVQLDHVPPSEQNEVSRLTLSSDNENRPEIKSNNSFLHDRVD